MLSRIAVPSRRVLTTLPKIPRSIAIANFPRQRSSLVDTTHRFTSSRMVSCFSIVCWTYGMHFTFPKGSHSHTAPSSSHVHPIGTGTRTFTSMPATRPSRFKHTALAVATAGALLGLSQLLFSESPLVETAEACGIVAFVGKEDAVDYLVEGLQILQSRGYALGQADLFPLVLVLD
jgi:hypothetical protein